MDDLNFARRRLSRACCQPGWLMSILVLLGAQAQSFAQEFIRRTQDAGLAAMPRSNGVALADYDRDGDVDIYFVNPGSYLSADPATWNRLFSNRGDGTFSDVTSAAGVAGRNSNATQNPTGMGNKMGASWGDYDNDGWPDL